MKKHSALALAASIAIAIAGVLAIAVRGGNGAANAQGGTYRGTPDDFMEISQLFSRYDYGIDNGDGDALAADFTPNGVFQDPSTCAIGRDQLIEVAKQTGHGDQEHFHMASLGPIIYSDRDHASVHSTVIVVRKTGFGIEGGILVTGTYDDTLIRLHGKWLFAYRNVHRPNGDKAAVVCPASKAGSVAK